MNKENELKEIFLAEASQQSEELNKYFISLEQNHGNKEAVSVIFRLMHTLKANAAAMGFEGIAEMAHLLEDIFSQIKAGKAISAEIFNDLFRANDKVGELIKAVSTGENVSYKGLKTKLKVILNQLKEGAEGSSQVQNIVEIAKNEDQQKIQHTQNQQVTFSDWVQVPISKLDSLLNLVSELAIEKDRLITQAKSLNLNEGFTRLYRITADLQYSVMAIRLVQISVLFNKFHRIIRDVSNVENKKVELILEGTEIEIDRNVLQIISDSLIHLVRNSVSHGIENPEIRLKNGKTEHGTIRLVAHNDKDNVIIEISDDGKGIDPNIIRKKAIEKGLISAVLAEQTSDQEIIKYIFEAGFSTAEQVTEVSGRGVGMDVVKKAVDSIGGKINTFSKVGEGTNISLTLPASMAVRSVLLFEVEETSFAIPLAYTEAVVLFQKSDIRKVANGLLATHLDRTLSIVSLNDFFSVKNTSEIHQQNVLQRSFDLKNDTDKFHVIIVQIEDKLVGLVVDKLLQQKEIIEKPLGKPLEKINFISGTTILGDGRVCLVLDIPMMIHFLFSAKNL